MRVLYLITHTTLVESECNILRDLGLEVYICKTDCGIRSCSVTYEFDNTLTLPKEVIEKLNKFDFYADTYPKELKNLINKHFDIAIIANVYPCALNIVKSFSGKVILRAFGYEDSINYEYTTSKLTREILGWRRLFKPKELLFYNEMTRALYKIKDRFILGYALESIIANETPFFEKHSFYIPCGCGESIWAQENTWQGDIKKIMFVCPSIETKEYGEIYRDFKNNFGDMPHSIFGKNIVPNEVDENIIGFLERNLYDKAIKEYRVAFYHSQEPRHIHYSPIESIIFGQPLIFMRGGVLSMWAKNRCIGEAKDIDEAREKIKRVLNGDSAFIDEVISSNKAILEKTRYDYLRRHWENFIKQYGGTK